MSRNASLAGKRVFITGAASGIGRALTMQCAAQGALLYLTDRNEDGLTETARLAKDAGGDVVMAETADIRSYDQVQDLGATAHASGATMDVVMNVAGVAAWGTVDRLAHRQWQDMIDVNLLGPIHVIETFVPPMIAAKRGGHLVNVASAAGLLGLPWHAAYSASKFGLRGVSEVLRTDLRPAGISVSLVCPGAVNTGLTDTIEIAGVDTSGKRFQRMQTQFRRHSASPEEAAAAILTGMRRRRYLIYTSRDIQLLYLAQRVAPHVYLGIMRIMRRVMQRTLTPGQPP
jgi:NAD(P)-dependent dehydrogenase (short-subunit alcohol dehydrogenase family)